MVDDNDNLLLSATGKSICIEAKELPLTGRNAVGNILIKGNKLNSVVKI